VSHECRDGNQGIGYAASARAEMTGQIEKFLGATKALGLAVRGLFGEGTEAAGDFYQLSNQTTLGVCEKDIVTQFEKIIIRKLSNMSTRPQTAFVARCQFARRQNLTCTCPSENANLISSQEALFLLSHIRLGLNMRKHQGASTPAINRLCSLDKDCADSGFMTDYP